MTIYHQGAARVARELPEAFMTLWTLQRIVDAKDPSYRG